MFAHNYHREAGTKRSAKYRLPRRPGGLLGMSNHSSLASEAKQSLPVSLSMRMRVRVRLNATSETLRSYPVRGLETGTIRKSGPVHGLPTRAFSAGVLRKRPARSGLNLSFFIDYLETWRSEAFHCEDTIKYRGLFPGLPQGGEAGSRRVTDGRLKRVTLANQQRHSPPLRRPYLEGGLFPGLPQCVSWLKADVGRRERPCAVPP